MNTLKLQKGESLTYVATAVLAVGDVVVFPTCVGIAFNNAEIDDEVTVEMTGVFERTATTADVIVQGDSLYWDDTAKELTTADGGGANALAGIAWTTKEADVAGIVSVKIG